MSSIPSAVCGGQWSARQDTLQHIVSILEASLSSNVTNQAHREIQQQVDRLSGEPEFCRYLAFIFSEADTIGASPELRYMSSLILLKALRVSLKAKIMDEPGLMHVKCSIIKAISDPVDILSRSACSLVSTFVTFTKVSDWPELVQFLKDSLQRSDGNPIAFKSSLLIFEHLCEDCGSQLDEDPTQPLIVFVPILLECFKNPDPTVRTHALRSINYLMELDELPAVVSSHAEDILQGFAFLSQDQNVAVKKRVCQGLTLLLAWRMDAVGPHLPSIVQLMVTAVQSEDGEISIEGCDFFTQLCEEPTVAGPIFIQQINVLIPSLLNRLPYSEEELMMLNDDDDQDTAVPDRAEDINPNVDDDEDNDYYSEWSARKAAGLALERIAEILPGDIALPVILPILQQLLSSSDWRMREAALLALGALAGGYMNHLTPHLPQLIPFLLEQTKDPKGLVRIMACWTLVKYTEWAMNSGVEGIIKEYVVALTRCMTDRNKKVQHSACSSLAAFTEQAGELMNPLLVDLSDHIVQAYTIYQVNNKLTVLDLIGTLYEHCKTGMSQPQIFNKVVPVIWNEFEKMDNENRYILFYLECFSNILRSSGTNFGPVSRPLYNRCIHIIETTLTMIVAAPMAGENAEDLDREFMNGALDVISAFADGFQSEFQNLWDPAGFLPLLSEILKDNDVDTLQVSFALVGDLARVAINDLKPLLPQAITVICRHVYPVEEHAVNLSSNASWALGLIAVGLGPDLRHFSPVITQQLVMSLMTDNMEELLQFNSAISLGRVAVSCPDVVSGYLGECGGHWCGAYTSMCSDDSEVDDLEKQHCLEGLFKAILFNPASISPHFTNLVVCLLSIKDASSGMVQACNQVIAQVKQALEASGQWAQVAATLSKPIVKNLEQRNIM